MNRYIFSGHESFQCKSIWLKKGYDFLTSGEDFANPESVAILGVGKNMVASIRFWLRAFGLTVSDSLQPIAIYLFNSENGRDQFMEDRNTLWLLHFLLVVSEVASLYYLLFVDYQREKKEFTKADLQTFVKRKCSLLTHKQSFNENTVRKDIGVMLKNYMLPSDLKSIEDFSALLIGLELLSCKDKDRYFFKVTSKEAIAPEIILFALIWLKGDDKTISFDGLQKISLIFCIPMISLIEIIQELETQFPGTLIFTDNSGIKNVQFLRNVDITDVLDHYYLSL